MTIRCLYGNRFSMTAEILRYDDSPVTDPDEQTVPGTWVNNQDPITGEIISAWVPGTIDNPDTMDVDEEATNNIVPCFVQGIYNSGIRAAGADERFGAEYFNIEYLKMWVPAGVRISKRDRVTNIRDGNGSLAFIDEEYNDRTTVYNVQGVTPRFDPWNKPVDQFILLEKVE